MAIEMRSLLKFLAALAVTVPLLAGGATAGELVAGGWLMPPRLPPPPPPPPMRPIESLIPPAPVHRAAAPKKRARPAQRAPARQAAPSDGSVRF
jgi:hypothetical protein